MATDNTVISALDTVAKVCEDNKIPLFLADPHHSKPGSTFSSGF